MLTFVKAAAMDGSGVLNASNTAFVCLMGVGVVFLGLVCIVAICWIVSQFFKTAKPIDAEKQVSSPTTQKTAAEIPADKRGEFIAAVTSVIAEDLGTDVSAIRVLSVKKL